MTPPSLLRPVRSWTAACLLAALVWPAAAQDPSTAERAAMLKATLAASQAVLRQYEWIETTVVSYKGDEKSRKQQRCYYGVDGGLQKVDVSESDASAPKRGLRGRIAERKKEELTDTMKQAVALAKTYVPPKPDRIQAAKDAGRLSLDVLDPGKRVRLNIRDYEKAGDNLGIEIDLVTNRPLGLSVKSYLDDPAEPVTLNVRMGQLDGATVYPADITLDAAARDLGVKITNSGYRKSSS